jgi:hypothetical protein
MFGHLVLMLLFERNMLPSFPAVKMGAAYSSETLASIFMSTWYYNPQD